MRRFHFPLSLELKVFLVLNTIYFFSITGQLVIAKVFVGDTELVKKEERFVFYLCVGVINSFFKTLDEGVIDMVMLH